LAYLTLANLVQGGSALARGIFAAMWQHAHEQAPWLAIDTRGVLRTFLAGQHPARRCGPLAYASEE
jgi:hypothetical protein